MESNESKRTRSFFVASLLHFILSISSNGFCHFDFRRMALFSSIIRNTVFLMASSSSRNSMRLHSTRVMALVKDFYIKNPQIKASHGITHVLSVHHHAVQAIGSQVPPLTEEQSMEVETAALLHDVDDTKYFPDHHSVKHNAKSILAEASVSEGSSQSILEMIDWVSASQNGNSVPEEITKSEEYYRLIPRWSDRLEAVGVRGVVRCYQYTLEKKNNLSSAISPRATTEDEVWEFADPQRFVEYQNRGGQSDDMIAHYYDKLLHVARPPARIVRNEYLEAQAAESAAPLVEVCLRFGATGKVDETYFKELESQVQ